MEWVQPYLLDLIEFAKSKDKNDYFTNDIKNDFAKLLRYERPIDILVHYLEYKSIEEMGRTILSEVHNNLPEIYQQIFELYYVKNMTKDEILKSNPEYFNSIYAINRIANVIPHKMLMVLEKILLSETLYNRMIEWDNLPIEERYECPEDIKILDLNLIPRAKQTFVLYISSRYYIPAARVTVRDTLTYIDNLMKIPNCAAMSIANIFDEYEQHGINIDKWKNALTRSQLTRINKNRKKI